MAPRISLTLDASDPERLVRFWCAALDYEVAWTVETFVGLSPASGEGPALLVQRVPEAKTAKNRLHLDLHFADFEAQVDRLVGLGATRVSDGIEEYGAGRWIVMRDPEGNEFCVCSEDC